MAANKDNFYRLAAKSQAASTKLYKVDSVVHVENKDDIWFWEQVLHRYRQGDYKFKPATINEKGKFTTGCEQCLNYKNHLSQKFFICIDSDLRYLLDEDICADKGILQTYTYSWENHCAFAERLQETFKEETGKPDSFDFKSFLSEYSHIVYKPLLLMLVQERSGLTDFGRNKFKECISYLYRKGDELTNGKQILDCLHSKLSIATDGIWETCGFNFENESAHYKTKGLNRENAYFYVRGHNLNNLLLSIGNKLCEGTAVDFKHNILKSKLAFEQYNEMQQIKDDIKSLNKNLRLSL